MKTLFTCHYPFNPNAGAAGVTWRLGQEYQKLGHEVQYYSLNEVPKQIHRLLRFATFPAFVAHQISQLADEIDVIDASTGDAWLWATLMSKLHKRRPLLVARCHGLEHIEHLEYLEEARRGNLQLSWKYPLYRGSIRLWEAATSMRCADVVLLLNERDRHYVLDQLGVDPDRAHVVANGIPDDYLRLPFEPTPPPDQPIRIAQVSSYIIRKGIQYGTPALNAILNRHPTVEVSMLGTECPADEVYADFDPGVRDRVKVIPSYQNNMLPALLKGHHIKLFPTISEGFGVALVEAMACGLAPITAAAPGPLEIVQDGKDAIVVPGRDSQALEQSLEQLIQDRSLLDRLRRNAYNTAQHYSWSRIAQDNLRYYKEAIARIGEVSDMGRIKI
ncbi:glycosyltransferase family 4 protein [Phormidesmis sp. 146-12]